MDDRRFLHRIGSRSTSGSTCRPPEETVTLYKRSFHGKALCHGDARNVAIRSVQMLGGYGYTKDYPVERYLRDIIGTTLYEGTSEVQRIVISREY